MFFAICYVIIYFGDIMNRSKEHIVVEALIKKGYRISFAESCTAGLAAARLVNVPAASGVFDAAVITYANDAKIKYLGVNPKSIEECGVVSETVAGEMAAGIAHENGAEIGVGISGVAGPTGGSDEKPIGTVCFGFYIDGQVFTYTKHFGDLGRNSVRAAAVEFVYDKLIELL